MELERNKKNRYGFDFIPIGLEIKEARESQKITRENLAETLDISPWTTVNKKDTKLETI